MSDNEKVSADELRDGTVSATAAEQLQAEQPQEETASAAEAAGDEQPLDHSEFTALLEDARDKADEHWNQCLRLQAEIENLRKRFERDLANAHKYALDRFTQELLPVRDSLEMAIAAFVAENTESNKLSEGVELTLQMLISVLEKFGITEVNPQDERFNPDFHQAMSIQERADVEPNTVVTVVQKGYLLHDRLIRPAMVIVSRAPAASDTGQA
ncbi:MAG: nucleotide exchange factor GrpE [Gammaproteobacteria bacterium]|nr:nucleotide exchange factor GrpE [Gammaproteobacteria bacterium]